MGRMRATMLVTPVAACLLLASCAGGVAEGGTGTLRTGEIRIPPKPTGDCAFDYRAAVSKVGPDGAVVWSTDVPWADQMPQPSVQDGAVVQATWNGPVGIDATDGAPLWQRDGGADGAWLGSGASGVVQSDVGDLDGLDPRSGGTSWSWSGDGDLQRTEPAGPAGSAMPIVAVHEGETISAIDTSSGATVWETEAATGSGGDQVLDRTADGTAFVALTGDSDVVALRSDTGAVRWRWRTAPGGLVVGPVQGDGDIALVHVEPWSGDDGTLEPTAAGAQVVAIGTDGRELWRAPYADQAAHTSLVTDHAVLLWDDGDLRALDPGSGEVLWRERGVTGTGVEVNLAESDGTVLVVPTARASAVVALDLESGGQLWRDTFDGPGFSPPTVVDGRVLVGGQTSLDEGDVEAANVGRLHAIDLATGEVLWSTTFRDPVRIAPVPVADGYVVTSADGSIGCD